MKKLFLPLLFLIAIATLAPSCKKDSLDKRVNLSTSSETLNIKISPNQSYIISLTEASAASISKQASHYSISETRINSEDGVPVYSYIPAKDFMGADEVVLSSTIKLSNSFTQISGGCPGSGNSNPAATMIKYTTVKITVGN